MGTWATINSNAYTNEIHKINPEIEVFGVSCPVLVSLVENNWIDEDDYISQEIIRRYITPMLNEGVDTIILGCTHFPHLAPVVQKVAGDGVMLIDTGYEAVMTAKEILEQTGLSNDESHIGKAQYYISDKTQNFSMIAKTLLGRDISKDVTFKEITKKE